MTRLEEIHGVAREIFDRALAACDIPAAFDRHLHFEGKVLVRHPSPRLPSITQPLEGFKDIYVIALGKAALSMLNALLDRLPAKIHLKGVCSAPSDSLNPMLVPMPVGFARGRTGVTVVG